MNIPISEKVKEDFSDNILLAKEVESNDDEGEDKEDESKLKVVPFPGMSLLSWDSNFLRRIPSMA